MKISRNVKKLMSFVMAMALVLSSLVFTKQAKAAGATTTPTVEVLGATLRLDDPTSQALRIGIIINNASAAKNCSITLTCKNSGKSVTLETGKGTADNIYDYNEATDKLIYTAVIKGIDATNFNTQFDVSGKVQSLSDSTWSEPTSTVTKSVTSVVKAMSSQLGTEFFFDGNKLMKKIASYDFEGDLSKSSFSTYFTHPEYVACNSMTVSEDAHQSTQAMKVDAKAPWGGIPLAELSSLGNYSLSCYVKKVSDDANTTKVRVRGGGQYTYGDTISLSDSWQELKADFLVSSLAVLNENGNHAGKLMLSPENVFTVDGASTAKFLVDDIIINKEASANDFLAMSLPKDFNVSLSSDNFATSSAIKDTTYADGTVSTTLTKESGGGGIIFFAKPDRLPVIASDYSKLRITVNSTTANAPLVISLRKNASTDYWGQPEEAISYTKTNTTAGEDTVIEINLSTNTKINNIPIYGVLIKNNQYKIDPAYGFTITIKSIEFIA